MQKLRQMQMIDYDDQMIYALRILEQYPEVLAHFREQYRYFCVDEAQDTSKIQHDMIDLLAAQSRNLFMVGDEDQSIYGFPGQLTRRHLSPLRTDTREQGSFSWRPITAAGRRSSGPADTLIQKNKTDIRRR